jgi:hypothetical protein
MKQKSLLLIIFFLNTILIVNAQDNGGGFQRRTPEERAKMVMDKLNAFNLDKGKYDEADSVFTQFYRTMADKRREMMSDGGMGDRRQMMQTMKKLGDERDQKLKKIFTDDQFKKWKDEIEPSLRPQRREGSGNT